MASYSRKATRNKALWGYLLLVVVLLSSSWFVYHEIGLLVSVREVEEDMTAKRHRVSDALSLLYRTETLGQSLVWGRYSDYPVYRRLMNDAVSCVDSLCNITADSVQLSRIDSIVYLLNRKNSVIRRLMSTSIDVAEIASSTTSCVSKTPCSLFMPISKSWPRRAIRSWRSASGAICSVA